MYTSHLATLQQVEAGVGQLAGQVVRGVWAALAPELLYFTNDDDERYSIQVSADATPYRSVLNEQILTRLTLIFFFL